MKERVQFHVDKFTDKNGNERHFVLCGLSQDKLIYIEFLNANDDSAHWPSKVLKLGYAICNPNDKFDEELGMTIAEGRARKNKEYALFAMKPGYINTDTVAALLKREAEFFKKNPETYIKGYERMVKK